MKLTSWHRAIVLTAVAVVTAAGIVWANGGFIVSDSVYCKTRAGYIRISSTGECRRYELQVELPQGVQGPQGIPGVDGRNGSDASVESIRCFQRLTKNVDLHGCSLPVSDLLDGLDLSGADLSNVAVVDNAPALRLGESRGYGHCAFAGEQLQCWGGLGDASTVPSDINPDQVLDVQSGVQSSCVLMRSGTLRCWGSAGYGQNSTPSDLGPVDQLAMGDVHTCVLTKAGDVRCWGNTRAAVQQVPAGLGDVTQLVSGGDFVCALDTVGDVDCWGWVPAVPTSLPKISRLYAGYNSVCALDSHGFPHCWGTDLSSLGGNFPSDLGSVKGISGGVGGMCAITSSDAVRCWGGFIGSLSGDRDGAEARPPVDLGSVRSISMGVFHACAVTTSNKVRCWGNDQAAAGEVTFTGWPPKVLTLTGARVSGADLANLPLANGSSACELIGEPKSLPAGWALVDSCLVR